MVIIMFILFTRKVNQRSWQRKSQFSHKNSLYLLTSQLPNFVKSLKTLRAVSFAIVNQNKIISELRSSLYSYEWTGVQTRCLFNVVNYINFIFYCFQPSSSTVSKLDYYRVETTLWHQDYCTCFIDHKYQKECSTSYTELLVDKSIVFIQMINFVVSISLSHRL